MIKKNKISYFPPEAELEKICQELSDPNYPRVNMGLSENSTPLEKSKYSLCQKILAYKQDKKLNTDKLAQEINLTVPETEDILFARINKFTLDRLVTYTDNLFSFQLEVNDRVSKRTLKSPVKNKKNIPIPFHNNSKLKSIHLRKK